jgi:probable F420-dependent oxidoreductase
MVMDISKYGVWFFYDGMTAAQSAEFARTVEKHRYGALWIPEAVGREPFAHAAYLAARTERLVFATGIANIYARDPLTMAAAAKTVGELSDGRFLLGIGVSHKPLVASLRGHSYEKPYSYMREYLPKMKSALYRAPEPKERVPVVLAALHPKMLELCAAAPKRGAGRSSRWSGGRASRYWRRRLCWNGGPPRRAGAPS